MSTLALKCVNNAIFKQIYTLKLLIAFKMAYSCCFSLGGNLDFLEFLQKSFITSTTEWFDCNQHQLLFLKACTIWMNN